MKNIRTYIMIALFAALTTVATISIQIPTPLSGYIHAGDAFVLLSGILISPLAGALAAGIGSMLADLFTGYLLYAPATLIIKALAALTAGYIYHKSQQKSIITTVIPGSIIVTGGYFLYEIILYGLPASLANIPFNIVQNIFGVILTFILVPVLQKIPILSTHSRNNMI